MNILVTGGAGYVGSHVVRALQQAGYTPVVYDNLSTGHAEAVREAELVVGDLADKGKLEATVYGRRFDGVIHLAAASLVGESMRNPSRYFRNNVADSLVLLDTLVAAAIPWLVLSSTAAVYGNPEVMPITESHPQCPNSPYGTSKAMLESILASYDRAYQLRSIALRYFNAAGAHESGQCGEHHDPETHLIPIILQVALGQRSCLEIYGKDYPTADGSAVRDYVHVTDLAAAHVAAVQHLQAGGSSRAYNLGSQSGTSVLEVVDMARKVTGKSIPIKFENTRPGDPAVLVADSRRARDELAWTPARSLEDIIRSAWNWHETHPTGYNT